MNSILFIRNSDVRYDTRQRKAMSVAIEQGYDVISCNWHRNDELLKSKISISNVYINTLYFKLKAGFGKGLKNIHLLVFFNIWIFWNILKLRKTVKIIHACDLDVGFTALMASKIFGINFVYDIFDFYSHTHKIPKLLNNFIKNLEYYVCRNANEVIVCTNSRRAHLLSEGKTNSVVILNTPDIKLLDPSLQIIKSNTELMKIGYVGTLCSEGRLLKEVIDYAATDRTIELHIAGEGELTEYIKQTCITATNIFWYGQLDNKEALSLQASCDILFATYDPAIIINKFSAPNKVYEAMALSKPIVVSKGTDSEFEVLNTECGCSINYSIQEFINTILFYKANELLMRQQGVNGRRKFLEKYSWDINSQVLKKLYSTSNLSQIL